MREIKFRAWCMRENKMHPVCSLGMDMMSGQWMAFINRHQGPLAESEIMQYTGLKDKNGTEIYEGDIIEWENRSGMAGYYVVEWNFALLDYIEDILNVSSVIGNIYENPELLNA